MQIRKCTGNNSIFKNRKLLLFLLDNLIRYTLCVVLFFSTANVVIRIGVCIFVILLVSVTIYEYRHIVNPLIQLEQLSTIGTMTRESDVLYALEQLNLKSRNDEVEKLTSYMRDILMNSYDSRMLRTQAEMRALQSQINPHFLYNTLENIRSQAIIKDCDEIAEMTEALSTLFRYSISGPSDMVTIRQELENTDHYISIQKRRFPDKFTVIKEIEDEQVLEARVPILTIQPLVENAIHHGLETVTENGTVRVEVTHTSERLKIMISDNGCGIASDRLERLNRDIKSDTFIGTTNGGTHTGIALYNINRRIRFYYGDEYGLDVYSTEGVGTSVEIELPFDSVQEYG